MKIHLIKKQTLEDFARLHPRSKGSLEDWSEKLKLANWQQPGDIKTPTIPLTFWAKAVTGLFLILQVIITG